MKHIPLKSALPGKAATYIILILLSVNAYSQPDTITARLRHDLIIRRPEDSEISRYLTLLNSNGSWNDIDYTDKSITNWQPVNHSGRLKSICAAYNSPSSVYFHKSDIKEKILRIINFYIDTKPVSDNWWYNAIGAPLNLGPALILMKTGDSFGFDQATLDSFADALLNYFSESAQKWKFATTGANKIWLLNSSIHKACIKNNDPELASNFRSAFEEAKIMDGKEEGIKSDYSFYQHGPQLYCGGYGMSFLNDMTYFGLLAKGTSYQMSDAQLQIITNAVLEGFQWFCQRSAFDFGATGREISRSGAGSSSALKLIITRLREMNPGKAGELTISYNFIDGTEPFSRPGNKFFWKSDIMVTHGKDFYLSARVPSKRTTGTERMNNENLKRKWLPWGTTNIMITGDEYHNIFPVWDWSAIPGVTSYKENVASLPVSGGAYEVSTSSFAGGVSDGEYGLAAYDYSWDGVSARKAYFFAPSAMYCLGAGISTSKSNQVITTVNQCISSGPVTVKTNGKISVMQTPEVVSSDLTWIYHNKVGYIFPAGGIITVKNSEQTGSWHDINLSQTAGTVTHKVFTSWIGYDKNAAGEKYEYMVVPSKSQEQFETIVNKNPLKVVINTPDVQCVADMESGVYGIAFYSPGETTLARGVTLSANKPCLLLVKMIRKKKIVMISAADPTQSLKDVTIKVSQPLQGGEVISPDNSSSVTFDFPSGDEAGKTVIKEFNAKKEVTVIEVR